MNKVAYVFPGQGSQSVGMLAELAAEYEIIHATFAEASAALGYDLWLTVSEDPENKLNQTQVTQPALLTASVAIYRLLQAQGVAAPALMAGHSLGEYSALVCAGAISLTDAVKLVESRGNYMQQAVPEGVGAMFAIIGLDDEKIQAICAQVSADTQQVVAAVNYNSPGQVVIAGNKAAVEQAGEKCKEAGAKRALPLPVSVPSHCSLMQPAADQLTSQLADLDMHTPEIQVINNVDVAIESELESIKDALVRQLYSPVRWTETVESLIEQGVTDIYEIGPGKVLTGLIKRINKSVTCTALNTPSAIQDL